MSESNYAWMITHDFTEDGPGDAGRTGPRDAPMDLLKRLEEGQGYRFKLYDDDREPCYTGRILAADEDDYGTEPLVFGPLDDFGTPNVGASKIRFPKRPEWDQM